MITDQKLDFWIQNNLNVLFVGHAGVGKTAMIKEAFERNELSWLYFSTATLDPWVDMIGVPKEITDPETGLKYIDLVRPKAFAEDSVQAIFADEMNRCLSGETKIAHPDGTSTAIKDLVGKDKFFVYSFDQKDKEIKIGKGHSARLTERNAKLLKITLDNGTSVRCTEDHPFLTYCGEFSQAKDLKVGQSLLPLYRRWSTAKKDSGRNGYEHVMQPHCNNSWDFTYHLADEYNLRHNSYPKKNNQHRHHIDKNKLNSAPDNIIRLYSNEHVVIHSADGGVAAHIKHPDLVEKTLLTEESMKKAQKNSAYTRKTSHSYKRLRSSLVKSMYNEEMVTYRSGVTKDQWGSGQFDKIDRKAALKKNYLKRSMNRLIEKGYNPSVTPEEYCAFRDSSATKSRGKSILSVEKIREYCGSFDVFKAKFQEYWDSIAWKNGNHRIIKIEDGGVEDVYDITVDEFENFALEGGIFVHNSPKKVRNALLEMIQFKSINGKKFHNLRMVWAAINPEEVDPELNIEYNVEKLDPAQKDRFHVIVNVPYKPSKSYFTKKYGDKFANAACAWWDDLDKKTKHLTSPRRLDYALDVYTRGGDLRDVLDTSCNITKLATELSFGPYEQRLKDIFVANDPEKAREFIGNANNWQICRNKILTNNKYLEFFLPLLDSETLSSVVTTTKSVLDYVRNASNTNHFRDSVEEIFKTYSDISKAPRELKALFVAYGVTANNSPIAKGIIRDFTDVEKKKLAGLKKAKLDDDRIKEIQNLCLPNTPNAWELTPSRQKLYSYLLFTQDETLKGDPADLATVANYIGIIMNRSHEMTLKTHFEGIQLLFVEVFNALTTYLTNDRLAALAKFNFAPNGLQKCEKILTDNGFIKP